MQGSKRMGGREKKRRGIILLTALVGMGVAGIFLSLGFRMLVIQRGHLKQESRRIQCDVLVSSGIARARSKLEQDRDYSGEIWSIPKEELAGGAEIRITVSPKANDSDRREIRIGARYPDQDEGLKIEKRFSWKPTGSATEKP